MKHCYIGLDHEGNFQLVISQEKLHPIGSRLRKGDDFPKEVYDFYESPEGDLDYHDRARSAILSMEAFLKGETCSAPKLEFGVPIIKNRRMKQ